MEVTRAVGAARLREGLVLGAAAALLARDLDLPTLVSYWGSRAPLVVGFAALVAALSLTPLRPLVRGAVLVLGCAWLVVAFTPVTAWLARDLPRRDPPGQADAVYVLASNMQEDGELTTPAMSRLLHGLELLHAGRAPRLILSELPPPKAQYSLAARALMANLGLEQPLLVVGPVTNTREEAAAVAALFKEEGWHRMLLVTSPLHSRRAAATFERVGLSVLSSPGVETQYDLERLPGSDDRLRAFGALLHELVGLQVYRYRGWVH